MSDQEPNEGVGSLFFELAGDLRLLMLTKLNQKNQRLSQLATELNATMQEAHRNMTRLIEAGLVAKGREGELVNCLWQNSSNVDAKLRFSVSQ